jgi:glycosyltransferase involved in cell wall biosynthesis
MTFAVPMKICILTTSFPLRKGDLSGIFMLEQGRHLMSRGISVRVVAPHHPGAPYNEIMDGIQVHRFRYFLPERLQRLCYGSGMPHNVKESVWAKIQLPFLLLTFTLQALWHARDCDVIHAHWSPAGLAGLIAARILGKPIVLTMHHGTTRHLTGIEKVILERVDYVLCNSAFTFSHVMKAARPRAIKVIPPGVDMDIFKPQGEDSKNSSLPTQVPAGHPIVYTLGRLIELKGHRYLIEAFRLLPEDLRPHLIIGGEGALREELEGLVRINGLWDRVTFLGHIPNHLTPLYYSLADIYVQPSIVDQEGNTEGLGVTLLEAMACETPCVGSRTGGIPDIIMDGDNGFLVDPANAEHLADKISVLLRDKDLLIRMGKQGRRFVEDRYSWTAKARELEEIYTDSIQQRGIPM